MGREANSKSDSHSAQELGGQLILKPAPRRGRWPNDDAIFLSHGRGLIQYEFVDYEQPKSHAWLGVVDLDAHITERIAQWVMTWRKLDEGLPRHYSPAHCREFDVQRHNREALAICRALIPLLPLGQQLCFNGAKRKAAYHRSLLIEQGQGVTLNPSGPPAAYFGDDRDTKKWVRVMGDYGGTGVWAWSGRPLDLDELPVSPSTTTRIADWARRFFAAHDSWRDGDADSFDRICEDDRRLRAYSEEGLSIARAIKAQLPDWTVVYFDTDQSGRHASRAVFQFEVT